MNTSLPADWDSRRRAVYRRDNYRCQNCGVGGGYQGDAELHAHHIVPRHSGGSNEVSNLKTLCNDCHAAIHHAGILAPTHEFWKITEEQEARLLVYAAIVVLVPVVLLFGYIILTM